MAFREMRRKNQELSEQQIQAALTQASSGVLAVLGDDGYPYAVPLSFVYEKGYLYFHSAKQGEKIDAIKREEKASFAIVISDQLAPELFTTLYSSLILFGKVGFLEEEKEKARILALFAEKYGTGTAEKKQAEVTQSLPAVAILSFRIEHCSGKQSKYLPSSHSH